MMLMIIVVPSKFTERTNISNLFLEYSENLKKILLKVTGCIQNFPDDTTEGKHPSTDARVLRDTGSILGQEESLEEA